MVPAVRRLLPYLLRYRGRFAFGLGCVLVTTGVSLVSPWILKHAVDDLYGGVTRTKLIFYAVGLLGVAAVGAAFRFLMRRVIIGVSRDIEYDLRNDFFARLQLYPLSYFQSRRTGDLMSRATNDLNAVRMTVGPAIMYSANTAILFVVAIALMLSIDWRLTLVALIPLPFVSIAVRYFGSAIHRRFERIQAQLSDLSAVAQEALAGVRVVRAYRQEGAELARFDRANREYLERNRRLIRLQGMFYPSMSFFLGLGALLVLWLGSREVIRGRITLGEFVAFNAYLAMLSWPMIAFGWVTNMVQRGLASWQRMLEVLEHEPEIAEPPADRLVTLPAVRGSVEFRHLSFAYGDRLVLDDVSVRIEPGQTVALVGPTGSGKSTLISLLPRLFDPPPGTVFVDGVDVRDLSLAQLRAAVGFVPQEPFLFSDSIGENIVFGTGLKAGAYGGPEGPPYEAGANRGPEGPAGEAGANHAPGGSADEAGANHGPEGPPGDARPRVAWAAGIARLDKDVAGFSKGYETMVGERGITMSGGQKQRTALARALAIDPRILVLDDALSAVDTYTEEEILSRLRGVMRERTSILVSHRISTVRDADLILVLVDGRIAERGTHDALVGRDGFYAELYRKQLLEEELAAS
jgi:ATP-binding cassette subfamily B protein